MKADSKTTDWQPINSAPKDGRSILAKSARVRFYQVIYWDDESKDPVRHWAVDDCDLHYHDETFGYWMELPDGP